MDFRIMHKATNYYYTDIDNQEIELVPLDNFTYIRVGDNAYALPYGMDRYEQLIQVRESSSTDYDSLLAKVITGIGITKYGVDTTKAQDGLNNLLSTVDESSDMFVAIKVMLNYVQQAESLVINSEEYRETLNDMIKKGALNLSKDEIKQLNSVGKELSPEITNYILPAFSEMIKQLNDKGFLAELKDPSIALRKAAK